MQTDHAPAVPTRQEKSFGDNCAAVSDVGHARAMNQDAFFADPSAGLFIVADGMGGHNAGEVASAMAVQSVRDSPFLIADTAEEDPEASLLKAFADAETAIIEHAETHRDCAGMGTTLVVGLLQGNALAVAHAGDVRGYLFRSGALVRLTNDHTAVGELLRDGLITEEDARRHPRRNLLFEAIGGGDRGVAPEVERLTLRGGDIVMLCSDGLWDEISHEEIASILAGNGSPLDLAKRLVDRACDAGGYDNITALVYRHVV